MQLERVNEHICNLYIVSEDNPYIDRQFFENIKSVVEQINADEKLSVIIMKGNEKYFSAGASQDTLSQFETLPSCVRAIPEILLKINVPVIAAMEGHGIGGGLTLGLLCDIALMANESLYGANFISMGFTPGMGSTLVVEEAFGTFLARKMLFGGKIFKGQELKKYNSCGIEVIDKADIANTALSLAKDIAMNSRLALMTLKKTLAKRRLDKLRPALEEEVKMHRFLFSQPETQKMITELYLRGF